ncbi:PsaN domain-containing protein [Cephalotus follicularis]|uniref:PsaN domain-containing protein n=1 Tax=Cephalotus follicularis TaxID=3775 RepID=A0A1Q3DEK1_CEPFO|nr:PsaN domain-containing protein [Cephalotus follicularis]
MSTIGHSLLMALTVTVNKYASSNVQAAHKREAKKPTSKSKAATTTATQHLERRSLLLSTVVAASQVIDSKTELLKSAIYIFPEYLKKTEENKAKNDKERLDSYYKRNYKDYFDFVEGSLKGKSEQELSESEKSILEWLKINR